MRAGHFLAFSLLAGSLSAGERLHTMWLEQVRWQGRELTAVVEQYGEDASARLVFRDESARELTGVTRLEPRGQVFGRVAQAAAERTPVASEKRARPRSPARAAGVVARHSVDLPPLAVDRLRAEDAAHGRGPARPRRVGMRRALPAGAFSAPAAGEWSVLPDGRKVWLGRVRAAGAEGVRLHLEEVRLPEGGYLLVHDARDAGQVVGPYGLETAPAGGMWTETVFSPDVLLECVLPAGAAAGNVHFAVTEVGHLYTKLDQLVPTKEGSCHRDVTCHPAWATQAAAVAGLGTVGDAGLLWCTGCLLADQDPATAVPYFMTAYHCVGSQTEASSLEFYWFFQTASCNGSPPASTSVPRTGGGADFLAGQSDASGNDFCFLRLRRAPPGGVGYAGWSTALPGNGTSAAGIHHPDGRYKRISFGQLTGRDSNFHTVRWSSGVTEPGSSGSPLFNDSQQFIGQLLGGTSACDFQSGEDYYGRFDISYGIINSYLSPAAALTGLGDSRRDFDGDGRADIGVYHPASGQWYIRRSSNGTLFQLGWGWSESLPVPGNFDGDGLTDIAVYHPGSGNWYIRRSSNGTLWQLNWGWSEALPVQADYDGDGLTDIAVYHPGSGNWYIRRSSNGTTWQLNWGWSEAQPVPGDYTGDGQADIAVFHAATGRWFIRRSNNGVLEQYTWGAGGQPVPEDFDGDGRKDLAVYVPATGGWTIRRSSDGQTLGGGTLNWGWSESRPVPGRYDADGAADITVYHPASGNWYVRQTAVGNSLWQLNWGWSEARPLR